MKRFLLFVLLALVSSNVMNADKVLDVGFDASGIKLITGDPTTNAVGKYGDDGYSSVFQGIDGSYLGYTYCRSSDRNTDAGNGNHFYYIKFNADDAVGQAIGDKFTFETLLRLDKIDGAQATSWTPTGSTTKVNGWTHNNYVKVIGCQNAGGFSLIQASTNHTGTVLEGFCPECAVLKTANAGETNYSNINMTTHRYFNQGVFYHVVFTYDKSTSHGTAYINGVQCYDGTLVTNGGAVKYPNTGTTRGSVGMYIVLGGDAANTDEPTARENQCAATFKFVRMYNDVKDAAAVAALYNVEGVRAYTEAAPGDMMLDVQFAKDNKAADASSYNTLGQTGTITTQYNTTQKRYEMVCGGTSSNFLKRVYNYDPAFCKALSEEYSLEVYASGATDRTSIISPMSGQQAGGGPGLEVHTDNAIVYNANVFGIAGGPNYFYSQGLGNLSAASAFTGDTYKHYVVTFKAGNFGTWAPKTKLYIDGVLVSQSTAADFTVTSGNQTMNGNEHTDFPFATWQWICIGGDCSWNDGTGTCDYPWKGNISIARVWGKALTDADVALLYTQAQDPTTNITIGTTGTASTCLPFNAVVPTGITAYTATAQTSGNVTLTEYATAGQVMAYGTPVILKGAAGTYTFAPAAEGATILAAPTTNLLEGTLASKSVTASQVYALAASVSDPTLAVMRIADALDIPANKAYLPNTDGGSGSKAFVMPGATGIKTAVQDKQGTERYFDLNGKRVLNPERGIYILNNKKVFVK